MNLVNILSKFPRNAFHGFNWLNMRLCGRNYSNDKLTAGSSSNGTKWSVKFTKNHPGRKKK